MQEIVQQLYFKMWQHKVTLREVAKQTKERKMNGGGGYSYHHVRMVLVYQKYHNSGIIELATQMVREKIEQEQAEAKRLEDQIAELNALSPNTEEE